MPGRNFVVAGGTKGIGLELVRLLRGSDESGNGDRVFVYSREQGELTTGPNVVHHPVDFTDEGIELANLPEVIHGAAYCPGTINLRSFRSLKPDDFRQDLEVNLIGAVKFLSACMVGLRKGGSESPAAVVLFSTVAAGQGMTMHSSIAASKAALEGLGRSLAAEWAPSIRVNCIAPALTDTPLAAKFLSSDEKREAMGAKYPLKRTGTARDLASMARFLLMPDSSWITGQVFGVDGGMSTVRS
ncbi:MAG: SDR family oxidoreductase [Planctomycetota bacterium]